MATVEWENPTNQYDLRVRRPDGRTELRVIVDRPRRGIEADIEFAANWAGREDAGDVHENWQVLSVTDMALLVTYLPSTLSGRPHGPTFYNRDHYVVPDRKDNPRFYDAQLVHARRPQEIRGYSFVVDSTVHPLDVAKEVRTHGLLQSDWKLVKQSLREIGLEQHYYLTWQRRQQPNYYLWEEGHQERQQGLGQFLTKKQSERLLALTRKGYVLRYDGDTRSWEVGRVSATGSYQVVLSGTTPQDVLQSATHLL